MPEFNTVNLFDYGLIVLYFAIVVAVGFYAARRNKTTDDYFKAGGTVPWFLAGMSNWVSGFSAFMFVAAAGFTYTYGIGAALLFTSAFWAYLIGYFYFAPRWRRARLGSPLEFLTRRYSRSTTWFYSITAIVPQTIGIGQGLYILCLFVATALGFSERTFELAGFTLTGFQAAVFITGAVMVLYTVVGGLWAAVLSDAVQGVIIAVMSIIILPVAYLHLGEGAGLGAGVRRLLDELPAELFTLQGPTADPWFFFSYLISSVLGYNVAWHLVQRYHSVPDERGARKMAMLCAILSVVGPLFWILPVLASRVLFPDIAAIWPSFKVPSEASFVSLALLLLPHGMIGFVVAAILSATLGQANDAFNWLAATTTRDIYVPARRKLSGGREPSDRHQLWVARGTMLVIGVLGVAVALYIPRFGGAFAFALMYYSLITTGFLMPVALGMIYRKTPWWSGIASCSAALTTGVTLEIAGVWAEHAYARNILSETIVASLVFFVSAFWFRADDPRHADLIQLEKDLHTPVEDAVGEAGSGNLQVYGLIGVICLVLGVVLVGCMLAPGSAVAPTSINGIAGGILVALGVGLRVIARRASSRENKR